jgi:hypothetical protein
MAMTNDIGQSRGAPRTKDAATNALAREEAAPDEIPVKQHNPGDKGINPDQRGPAQPAGDDATDRDAGGS